jgi:HD-GYP domain-containing protein (c-di-GMP phosphodiesterase class II)
MIGHSSIQRRSFQADEDDDRCTLPVGRAAESSTSLMASFVQSPHVNARPELTELLEDARPRAVRPLRGRELVSQLVVAGLFLAVAVPLALLAPADRAFEVAPAAVLLIAFAVASRIEFDVGAGYTVPTQLVFVPMLFELPTPAVPLLVAGAFALGKLPDVLRGSAHPDRLLLALSESWFSIGPAVILVAAGAQVPDWGDWPIYVAALVSQFGCDFAAAAREWPAHGVSPRVHLQPLAWVYLVDALLAPIGLVAAFAAEQQSYAYLLVLPLLGLLALFSLERRVRTEQALALSHAYRGTAMLLGDLVEEDDAYTGRHSRGVVGLALNVADELGLDPRSRSDLEFAALLHDVGKVAIPKEIINKAGKLTYEEMALVRTHTIEGHRILSRFGGALGEVGRIVRSCHERWDGKGYPDGLAGERIPLAARVIFVCDALNAMTTDRTYREARPQAEALAELRANAGAQFDPRIVEVVVALVEERGPEPAPGEPVALPRDQALA